MATTLQKTLIELYGATGRTQLEHQKLWNPLLRELDGKFTSLELLRSGLETVIGQSQDIALARINEVLIPAIETVLEIQERGFLMASSSSSVSFGVGAERTFLIGDDAERALFTPSKFLLLSRLASPDSYGIAETLSWDKESGELVVEIISYAGATGPFTDWVIAALAGSTIAQQQMLGQASAIQADVVSKHDTVVTRANEVATNRTLVASDRTAVATDRNTVANDKAIVAADKNSVAVNKAAVDAALASIAGGPVASIDGKTGVVLSDIGKVSLTDPTLDWDFTNIDGAPFRNALTRATVGGYRRTARGVYVATGADKPVIDHAADGQPLGTGLFRAYTNTLLNSAALATQGVAVSAVTYTLSFRGTGSVALSGAATGNLAGTSATDRVSLTFTTTAGTLTLTVTGSVLEASLTATAFPVPYVPTTGSAVVRDADVFTLSGTDFSDFFKSSEGTFFVECVVTKAAVNYPTLLQADDGSNDNRHAIYYDKTIGQFKAVTTIAATAVEPTGFAAATDASVKVAMAYATGQVRVALGGVAQTATIGTPAAGINRLRLGVDWDNYVKRLMYWPKALSTAELQKITA